MIFVLLLGLFYSSNVQSQCASFARAVVKPELSPFIHDGNYNATILAEGESVLLRKTVFEGQKYRIVVKGVPELPGLRFRVIDSGSQVLFDNALYEYADTWDFDVQDTRTISVEVTVREDNNPGSSVGGCVAVLFGLSLD
ncbi:hypothetical protein [Marinilabilia rubra]|uniref:hypothetical protein n=1 Tax=Marinilabilia rubra TaxID=2162893 RepID=UPI001E2BDC5D|nr:hypothetical protein [Marinilabilia rubra]